MNKNNGIPAVGIAILLVVSVAGEADHIVQGEYKTLVAEDRLFVEDGRVLRCDLFFSTTGMDTVVAPKGSTIVQSVPQIVWQFSALLPVSKYRKTSAIHSVSTDEKIRPWQDVQNTFYKGLLVEGATDMDAKIAFAGAYSFSPRWTLVELIKVDEAVPPYPDTELYSVEYIRPAIKGMTLDGYRRLALDILRQPEEFTLDDIKSVVDAADSLKDVSDESASLAGDVSTNEDAASNESTPESGFAPRVVIEMSEDSAPAAGDAGIATGANGTLLQSSSEIVVKTGDDELPTKPEKVAEGASVVVPIPDVESTSVVVPIPDAEDTSVVVPVTAADVPNADTESAETVSASRDFVENEILSSRSSERSSRSTLSSSGALTPRSAAELEALDGPENEWATLPDGTLVLRSTN